MKLTRALGQRASRWGLEGAIAAIVDLTQPLTMRNVDRCSV